MTVRASNPRIATTIDVGSRLREVFVVIADAAVTDDYPGSRRKVLPQCNRATHVDTRSVGAGISQKTYRAGVLGT